MKHETFFNIKTITALILLIIITFSLLVILKSNNVIIKDEKNFQDYYFSDELDQEEYVGKFKEVCPDLNTCPGDELLLYVSKFIKEGFAQEAIPEIFEIKVVIKERLSKEDPSIDFWNLHSELLLAEKISLLGPEEMDTWLTILSSINTEPFCKNIFEQTGKFSIEGESNFYCQLGINDILSTLITLKTKEQANVNYFESEEITNEICKDISAYVLTEEFDFVSGQGVAYLNYKTFCTWQLTSAEIGKIKAELNEPSTTITEKKYKELFTSLI